MCKQTRRVSFPTSYYVFTLQFLQYSEHRYLISNNRYIIYNNYLYFVTREFIIEYRRLGLFSRPPNCTSIDINASFRIYLTSPRSRLLQKSNRTKFLRVEILPQFRFAPRTVLINVSKHISRHVYNFMLSIVSQLNFCVICCLLLETKNALRTVANDITNLYVSNWRIF